MVARVRTRVVAHHFLKYTFDRSQIEVHMPVQAGAEAVDESDGTDVQGRRFKERESHPLKSWKLSHVDSASLGKWEDYTRAKESMFFETDTTDSPWTVIKSDCKNRASLNTLRYVLHKLPYDAKDLNRVGELDPHIVGRAHVVCERGERPSAILL
jgi:hypothetical protein